MRFLYHLKAKATGIPVSLLNSFTWPANNLLVYGSFPQIKFYPMRLIQKTKQYLHIVFHDLSSVT